MILLADGVLIFELILESLHKRMNHSEIKCIQQSEINNKTRTAICCKSEWQRHLLDFLLDSQFVGSSAFFLSAIVRF